MNILLTWSRREFLTTLAATGAGAALLNPLAAWAGRDEPDPRVAALMARTLGSILTTISTCL